MHQVKVRLNRRDACSVSLECIEDWRREKNPGSGTSKASTSFMFAVIATAEIGTTEIKQGRIPSIRVVLIRHYRSEMRQGSGSVSPTIMPA